MNAVQIPSRDTKPTHYRQRHFSQGLIYYVATDTTVFYRHHRELGDWQESIIDIGLWNKSIKQKYPGIKRMDE